MSEVIEFREEPVKAGEPALWLVEADDAACEVEEGGSRPGTPLPTSSTVENVEECCTACDDATGCVAWNFETATGKCNHLDTVSHPIESLGFSTGVNVGR